MLLGVYKGNGSDGRKAIPSFETFMGRRIDLAFDFIDFSNRAGFDGDEGWALGGWRGYDRPLVLAVPLLCKGETFADIVAGKHDASYAKLAANIKANGISVYAIRLGWEDNSDVTTPGHVSQDAAAGFANYRAARRRIYALLKAALPDTLILQDVSIGWQNITFDRFYDAPSCDALGLTVYPQTWSNATAEPAFTANLLNESWGLKGFGTWPPKPVIITEYGAAGTRSDGHGAPNKGDDPMWTQTTLDLFKSWGKVLAICVWDFHAGDFNGLVSDGSFPQSGAVLKAAFAPTPAASTAPPAPVASFTAKVTAGQGTVTIEPNADGSAWLHLNLTGAGHHYVSISEPRQIGFSAKSVWFTGRGFDWNSAGTGKVWVGAK